MAQHLRGTTQQDKVSSEEAFIKADKILGIDPTSDTLTRDISRARRRLSAEIGVSDDNTVMVGELVVDHQTVIQIADALTDADSVDVLVRLHQDEPLREFLVTADPTWAGRVRQQDYYSSESFERWILPSLKLALAHALAESWDNDWDHEFQRLLRLTNHVPALPHDIEMFLDRHIAILQAKAEEVDEGDSDPDEKLLPVYLHESVSVVCLNALPEIYASYRSSFYQKIRDISLTCVNDFDCSSAALEVLLISKDISVDESEDNERSEDLATLHNLANHARLETEHRPELHKIQKACDKIENLTVDKAIAKSHILGSVIPFKVFERLPDDLKCLAGDRVAAAFRGLAAKVWNEDNEIAASRRLLDTADNLPLTDKGKLLIQASRERLEEVYQDGINQRLNAVIEGLTTAYEKALEVVKSPTQVLNNEALNDTLHKSMEIVTPTELKLAHRHGRTEELDRLLEVVAVFAPLGSTRTCGLAARWIELLAEVSNNAQEQENYLRRERVKKVFASLLPMLAWPAIMIIMIIILSAIANT